MVPKTRFSPCDGATLKIGNLKVQRFGHKIEVVENKLFIIVGAETFKYCDLVDDFACSVMTDAKFEQEDNPILYGFYPSKCELGI